MIIKSKRLFLSPMTVDELRSKVLAEPDEELQQAYREMLQGLLDHPEDAYWYTAWNMLLKDGTSVGDLCFKGPPKNGAVDIGYGVNKEFEGQGYATEATKQLCDWAFTQKGVYFITAETDPENAASQRVLAKCGFKPTDRVGEEGPIFELEKEPGNWTSIMLCLGMGAGCAFGAASDNIAIGISLGMLIGVAVGIYLDSAEKKARKALRDGRGQ